MGKKVGVLFSGGLDSTYLVWKNLKDGNTVIPIYVELRNNKSKSILEKNRIKLLHEEFCQEFNKQDSCRIGNIIQGMSVESELYTNILLKQVPMWITALIFNQNHGVDELQIGYVGGDDAISFLSDIKKIYKGFNKLNTEPLKKITFPLKKESKYDIMAELPHQYKELIVSCEEPRIVDENAERVEYTPCGNCPPCNKILASGNFGAGLSSKYREVKLDQALSLLREYAESNYGITHRYDEKEGLEHFTREYESPYKMSEPHQLRIDFDNMSDQGEWGIKVPDYDKIEAKEECYSVKERPENG